MQHQGSRTPQDAHPSSRASNESPSQPSQHPQSHQEPHEHQAQAQPPDQPDGTLTFAVFALRDLKAHEEVVLGWEWDDGHAIHALPAFVKAGARSPTPENTHHLHAQMTNLLHLLASTFPACACGAQARDCAIRQIEAFVEAKRSQYPEDRAPQFGPLVGPHATKRGFRTRVSGGAVVLDNSDVEVDGEETEDDELVPFTGGRGEDKFPPKMRKRWIQHLKESLVRDVEMDVDDPDVRMEEKEEADKDEGEKEQVVWKDKERKEDEVPPPPPPPSASPPASIALGPAFPPPKPRSPLPPPSPAPLSHSHTKATAPPSEPGSKPAPRKRKPKSKRERVKSADEEDVDEEEEQKEEAVTVTESPSVDFARLSLLSPLVVQSVVAPTNQDQVHAPSPRILQGGLRVRKIREMQVCTQGEWDMQVEGVEGEDTQQGVGEQEQGVDSDMVEVQEVQEEEVEEQGEVKTQPLPPPRMDLAALEALADAASMSPLLPAWPKPPRDRSPPPPIHEPRESTPPPRSPSPQMHMHESSLTPPPHSRESSPPSLPPALPSREPTPPRERTPPPTTSTPPASHESVATTPREATPPPREPTPTPKDPTPTPTPPPREPTPTPRDPTPPPAPPPPPKVKMSLRDYMLRKQKRREEEEEKEKEKEEKGVSDGVGDEGSVGVEESQGGGEGEGTVHCNGGHRDMEDVCASSPAPVKDEHEDVEMVDVPPTPPSSSAESTTPSLPSTSPALPPAISPPRTSNPPPPLMASPVSTTAATSTAAPPAPPTSPRTVAHPPLTLKAKTELIEQQLPVAAAVLPPKPVPPPTHQVNGNGRPLAERIGAFHHSHTEHEPESPPRTYHRHSSQEDGEISLGEDDEDTPPLPPPPPPPRRIPPFSSSTMTTTTAANHAASNSITGEHHPRLHSPMVPYVPSSITPPKGPRALRDSLPSHLSQIAQFAVPPPPRRAQHYTYNNHNHNGNGNTSSMPARAPPTGPRSLRLLPGPVYAPRGPAALENGGGPGNMGNADWVGRGRSEEERERERGGSGVFVDGSGSRREKEKERPGGKRSRWG
ncbi:hypothetical protein DXG03_000881, partial [Asterophora parasitica]